MKKLFAAVLIALFSVSLTGAPANAVAEEQWYEDRIGDAGASPSYLDVTSLYYSETETRPNVHYFFLGVNGQIPANVFSDGLGSWAMVSIDVDFDNVEDYRLEVDEWRVGTRSVPIKVWDMSIDEPVPGCTALMYVLPASSYFTFTIDYACLKLPRTFSASGYTQYGDSSGGSFDWTPDDSYVEFTHSFNGFVGARRSLDKPSLGNEVSFKTASPTKGMRSVPANVENATVTIYCQDYVGVGWSMNANIPANVRKDGFKSFIVTSYSNIAPCLDVGVVRVSTHRNENFTGYLSTWDAANDLAGIYVETALPTLSVRGEKPAKNWWVGSTGTSIAYEDNLLQGRMSIAPISDWSYVQTSMLATSYTYGAPVFDKSGRVLGTITSVDDTMQSTFVDATALCSTLVKCGNNKVWISGLKALPKVKTYSNCSALNRDYPGGVAQNNSRINKGKAIKNTPFISGAVFNKNKRLDRDKDGIICER